jgi:hypothetical protein
MSPAQMYNLESNPPAAVDAPIARLVIIMCLGRRATEQDR